MTITGRAKIEWRHGPKPVIGLVGGIGAGKSTAARCFERRGGMVIDADSIGHTALGQPSVIAQIVARWGEGMRKEDGNLDRGKISRIVFAKPEERNALEQMVFPFIGSQCFEIIARGEKDSAVRFLLLDAAVMLEAGWNQIADKIVYVDAPREERLLRVGSRSGWTEADLAARELAQWSEAKKKAASDAVLLNDSGPEELQMRVDSLLREWGLLANSN